MMPRDRSGNAIPYPAFKPVKRRRRWPRIGPIVFMVPIAAFTAVWLWDGGPPSFAIPAGRSGPEQRDGHAAHFSSCASGSREACVIDGDTFWYRGQKIRIADINAPETGEPRCAEEAELGARATARLTELLNAGAFSLELVDREADKYGRSLRVVTRGGESLGARLEDEGLAEHWQGHRRDWC